MDIDNKGLAYCIIIYVPLYLLYEVNDDPLAQILAQVMEV